MNWRRISVLGLWMLAAGCTSLSNKPAPLAWQRYEFDRTEMAVPFRLVIYAPMAAQASAGAEAAYQRIQNLNDCMTDYEASSELSHLSDSAGSGRAVPVSPDLWTVLQRAQKLAQQSGGAFDITVGPFVNLWRQARREKKLPDPARLAKAAQAVGYRHLQLNAVKHTATLLVPGMRLDLGGIAKGYAVSQAVAELHKMSLNHVLVSGGGDIQVSGPPPGKTGWRVELPPLDASNAPPARYVTLANAGLSTSGDLFQHLEIGGKRYSHIVDPRTGLGLTDHSLVTVIAGDDFIADGLTKIMSVLAPPEALQFSRGVPGMAVRIVRQPGTLVEVYESKAFNRFYR